MQQTTRIKGAKTREAFKESQMIVLRTLSLDLTSHVMWLMMGQKRSMETTLKWDKEKIFQEWLEIAKIMNI